MDLIKGIALVVTRICILLHFVGFDQPLSTLEGCNRRVKEMEHATNELCIHRKELLMYL